MHEIASDGSDDSKPVPRRKKRQLLAEIRDGSETALGELLQLYRPFLRIWARRQPNDPLRNKFDTSDLIQETHHAALKRLAEFQQIADNEVTGKLRELLNERISASRKHYWRAKKRRLSHERPLDGLDSWNRLDSLLTARSAAQRDATTLQEDRQRVELLLTQLPEKHQVIIRQRLWDGLEWEAIAERLDCTPEAARKRFKRAIARFTKLYRREYPDS
ncbi:MAG: sigma-70 family RNA polymerase sigma factor [Pirellulales bacterium]|nr:sigma-70 family RNA polymerase sigma factor [Pirellulales bacterium]